MLNAVVNASKEARRYAQESLGRYYKLVSTDAGISHQTLFTKLHQSEKQREITFEEICANAQGYILAGSDTTASTLTYLIWSVCRQPDIKDKLLQQLRALPPRFEDNHLRKLPYLSHVVDETLRLYPAAPSGLPRETPIGGTVLGGYQLDAGTVVCAQSYSLHRNTRAFPNPEQFDPQRWTMPSTEMMDSFMPFGRGPRGMQRPTLLLLLHGKTLTQHVVVCIGLHLARMELRAATANFFLSFPNARLSSREGFTDNSMRPKMFFVSNPVERRCLIEF